MWRSLVVLVSLVLVLSAAQAPPFPCTFTDPVSGNLYDLSGAWRDPTSQSDYSFQNSLYTYNVNVCGNAASCPPDAGACQIEADRDIERSIGQAENATWAPLAANGTKGVTITYNGGANDFCFASGGAPRKTILNIACDSSLTNTSAVIDDIKEQPLCTYTVSMRSQFACPVMQQGAASFVSYLQGGLPFCTQCGGAGEYACSNNVGDWTTSFPFRDPVTNGSVVTRITVSLLGSYACSGGTMQLEADINGFPVNIEQRTGSGCACNTCDGEWMLAGSFPPEVAPFYNYGQTNNITLKVVNNQLCLNSVNITVYWDLPQMVGSEVAITGTTFTTSQSYRVCGSSGYNSQVSMSYSFSDPLPEGALLIQAYAQFYGAYYCYSTSPVAPSITASLAGTTVGTAKLPSKAYSSTCTNPYQCDGGVWSSPSLVYQLGWPTYAYNSTNTVTITTTQYPRIGRVSLFLVYYSLNMVKTLGLDL